MSRAYVPPRAGLSPLPQSMFPHTVTLYRTETCPQADYRDGERCMAVRLKGVLLQEDWGGEGRTRLYIPWDVEALDPGTGAAMEYVPPCRFRAETDRTGKWTLSPGSKDGNGDSFFLKGEGPAPGQTPPRQLRAALEAQFDGVYQLLRVQTRDFGTLRHWEVEGA